MSMLDGFLGYNQILVDMEDTYKTTFTKPWGTYAYNRMMFKLKNAGATLQREMDHAFKIPIGKTMADYQYDLTIHSRQRQMHLNHLQESFFRCIELFMCINTWH